MAGQTPPGAYVQPFALVARDQNGNWQFLQVDGSGNLITNAASASGGTQTIASGTVNLAQSAIASGSAAPIITVPASGVLSTDCVLASFNSDPTSTTGYIPSTNGMLTIIAFPTAGNVNFYVINNTQASITPGAVTLNWRVVR